MQTTEYVAGIDGGGTKTAAVIIDNQGRVLGAGEGGPSTYGLVADAQLYESLQAALLNARRAAGLAHAPLSAAFLGLGNVVTEQDQQAVRQVAVALEMAPAERIGVDHDCRVALAGGLAGQPGIVLIAGTGTSCFGINAQGASWRSGGWGPLIDDGGSGYWLGIQAMRAAVLDYDGRGAPTVLRQYISEQLQLPEMNALMNRLYAVGLSRTEIARFAPLVFAAAEMGDEIAAGLIQQGCALMADSVLAVARRLEMERTTLAVVGGLTRAGEGLFTPLKAAVQARLPHCQLAQAAFSPVIGAGILALELCGRQVDDALLAELQRGTERAVG